ncbi:RNA polymerase sigma factor [Aneurinibacillus aneurinilyticus]|jgi:RNA polymerase sigma-70 factor (ECF subfamily)|uniref:Sigma-70 family RNA polymerase sigma factor n=2 Tax=Aneurinibacillus aneurinilyticus TaxID=1391 RepID=A0A848CRB3_ANEAE|nr:sigma-70 family RNA polymerase sigma factor [Aneurinibacillus aneurinilyticus]ERI08344.1 putative RNA polymerase sigma-H factor [Aneurinibacillus aneurinilyticus ATCC 12856]MCI1692953.1 sigma-70 family RNA polymerase sigma factor [Aneurinibacillus aneurinilyticus]MED0669847.1 sigma-70 family RNA polymerase sigma factor [Aneurinibacillus aneurinilyticus]MED0705756.1 sigma-70 family RNA polymerase sigma factor [Aneurinibacillus aneurinilyticus]MED0725775.1 sigma-70 family RNA polymerase sigma
MLVTDSQLIREIKDGRVECYAELINRYERRILAFILHMLKSYHMEDMAEDLAQETFYKAFRSLHSFRDVEASFSTWLYTIARNTVLSELRKSRNSEVYLEDSKQQPARISVDRLPEQELLRTERVHLVRQAINKLPEKQRTALILREYEQLDYKEIAVILDSTVSSVKSLLFRARHSIKQQLEPYMIEAQFDEAEGMR